MENEKPIESLDIKKLSRGKKVLFGSGIGCIILIVAGGILSYYLVRVAVKEVDENTQSTGFERFELSLRDLPKPGEEDREKYEAGVGGTLYDNEAQITVNAVERKDGFDLQKPFDGNDYLVVDVTLKNITDKETAIYTSNFSVRDNEFNKFYTAFLDEDVVEDPISVWQFIPREEEITGVIVFEIKKDADSLVLQYSGTKDLIFNLDPLAPSTD